MPPSQKDFDAYLSDISTCITDRELSRWRRRIVLPFSIITRDGPVVLETDDAVAENFANYLEASDIMGLDLVSRRPISFEDCGDGTWLGTYETRLVSRGVLATRPYVSTALLTFEDGILKMSSILNGRGHHEWTGKRPMAI